MSGETDAACVVKKSVLKLICSELEEHPTKAGVIRFTAPKTKLEPYPDYDEKESDAAKVISESADAKFKKGSVFSSDEKRKVESDEFSEGSEEFEDDDDEASYTESDDSRLEIDDNAVDGYTDSDSGEYTHSSEEGATAEEEESDYDDADHDAYANNYSPKEENSIKKSSKRASQVKPPAKQARGFSRSAYELSKRARFKRERADFERSKPRKPIETKERPIRRSARIKNLRAISVDGDEDQGAARPAVAKRVNPKAKVGRPRSNELPRTSTGNSVSSAVDRKRRTVVSNSAGGSAKRSRRNCNSERVPKRVEFNKGEKRAVGRIIRGYNKPDKPASPKPRKFTKSGNGASTEEEGQQEATMIPGPQENPFQTATASSTLNNPPTALQDNSYNPEKPLAYSGFDVNKFKNLNPIISRHKPRILKFRRNPIISRRLFSNIFADTIHAYKNFGSINDGYKYILVVIDGLSRRLFARPLVGTTSKETYGALKDIFTKEMHDRIGHSFFETDQGPEFMGEVPQLLEKHQMTPMYLQGPHKAAPAERVM